MDIERLASQIVESVGGRDNVKEVFHCVTRLRFYLNDRSKADLEALRRIPGVLGVSGQTEQLQVIIGNEVDVVCNAVQAQIGQVDAQAKLAGDIAHNKEEARGRFRVGGIFETISAIILPVIPALAGTGILKGIVTIMTSYLGFAKDDPLVLVLTMAADVVFYFMPFFIAWSAAKRFKTDTAMSMVCAGLLLYPTMTAGLAAGSAPMSLFGLPIPFVKYSSSFIPVMLSVWVLRYVYAFVDTHMPKMLRLVFTPLVVVLVMAPIALGVTGPVASYLASGIATFFTWLFEVSPVVAGAVIGGTRSLLVFTGMHLSLGAVILANINQYGYDYILPINTMGTMAIVGVCLGVWIKAKKPENKEIGMSTLVSSFLGITEPGIYGVLMVFRNALIADVIAGAVAGAWAAYWHCTTNAYVNSCILSLPVFVDEHFPQFCIGMVIAVVLGAGIVMFLGIDEGDGKAGDLDGGAEVAPRPPAANVTETVSSPLTGEVELMSRIDDAAFASEALGRGIAIVPSEGIVAAPFDGIVIALYPSKHAIGLRSESGIECLIHIGIDTVNLGGRHFSEKVGEGQRVRRGDVLIEFDIEGIRSEGYSLTTPIVVTNSASYADVFPAVEAGTVERGGALITVLR